MHNKISNVVGIQTLKKHEQTSKHVKNLEYMIRFNKDIETETKYTDFVHKNLC